MPKDATSYTTNWGNLRQAIDERFSLSELNSLIFDLGIDDEKFGGNELPKPDRIIRFIKHILKQNRVPDLLDTLKTLRPNFTWPDTMPPMKADDLLVEEALAEYSHSQDFEPETVFIPAGSFRMGSAAGEGVAVYETDEHEVMLPAFRIGVYPVTNEQYERFVRETGQAVAPEMGWTGRTPKEGHEKYPVTAVTWYDAVAYCKWLSAQTGQRYTLPSEAQWERAARGTDGRIYPWGNAWEDGRCNWGGEGVTAVDAFPPQSEDGCYDLVGNIRQWTRSLWGTAIKPLDQYYYPWSPSTHDPNDILKINLHMRRVYRGSAYCDDKTRCQTTIRRSLDPKKTGVRHKRHGFRVILTIKTKI